MTVPLRFPLQPSPSIATYDWVDIADGTGIRTFYIAQAKDTSGTKYLLLQTTEKAAIVVLSGTTAYDYDFDLTSFNKPQTVKGTVTYSLPFYKASSGDSTIGATLYKYDGTTETALHTEVAVTYTSAGVYTTLMKAALTQTNFAIGDTLRVRLNIGAASGSDLFGTDPADRVSGSLTTTQAKVLVPFKIDL